MDGSYIRVRLADGLEVIAKSITMEMPVPSIVINRNGRRILEPINESPIVIIELDDAEHLKLVKFFGPINTFLGANLDNAIRELKIKPKPGLKRLIDLS